MCKKYRKHIIIPDTQVSEEHCRSDHLVAIGNYIADQHPDVIVHVGDHWDLPSLSSYEKKGSKFFEGRTYARDVEAGNVAFDDLSRPIRKEIGLSRRRSGDDWEPELHLLRGNHEDRIRRATLADPVLEGSIRFEDLDSGEWNVHPFLKIINIDGILYSHYFINQQSVMKNGLTGTPQNRLNKVKHSFTQGHTQGRQYGSQFTAIGKEIHGLVVGSCYQHDEGYMPDYQGNFYWRGIVVKNEVHDGEYDIMFVSLNYLLRKWL